MGHYKKKFAKKLLATIPSFSSEEFSSKKNAHKRDILLSLRKLDHPQNLGHSNYFAKKLLATVLSFSSREFSCKNCT